MTIEAGALSLRISEVGGEQVLATLTAIDKKAQALGQATQSVKFNAGSTTGVNGELQKLSANFTQVGQAAASSAPALEKQAVAQSKVATTAALVGAETSGIARAGAAFAGMATALGAVGVAISAGALLGNIVSLVREAIDAGDSLHDLTMRTGVSVQTLSVLGPIAQKSGASMEVLTMGFRNLNKETDKARLGNKEAVLAFSQIGISVDDLKGKNPEQVFLMVANALEQYEDGAFKTAEASKLLGRSGEQLIPTMHELADGGFEKARAHLESLGALMGPDFADKADSFNDQLVDMHTALLGLGIVVADQLLPFLTRMADLFTILIVKSQHFGSALENMLIRTPVIGPLMAVIGGMLPASFAGVQGGSSSTAALLKKKAPPAPSSSATASAEDRAMARALEKAMGADLGGMGVVDNLRKDVPEGTLAGVVARSEGLKPQEKLKGVKAFGIGDVIDKEFNALAAKLNEKKEFINGIIKDVAGSVGSAFGDAFTAAFEGGNFFAALGKSLLSSIGGMIMQLGEAMLTYGTLMAIGAPLLMASPFAGQALSAPAAIAGGIGLIALGAGMGAIGKGGKGGGGGGGGGGGSSRGRDRDESNAWEVAFDPDHKLRKRSGPAVIPSARGIDNTPMPTGPGVVNIGVINTLHPDNAEWQRTVSKTVSNARARGLRG